MLDPRSNRVAKETMSYFKELDQNLVWLRSSVNASGRLKIVGSPDGT